MFYSLDKLKPKTKTKNQNIFGVNENSMTFLYTFEKGGQEKVFLEGEKTFFF